MSVGDKQSEALMLDVIVVGAGQAGLATAYVLQRAGVRARVFDGAARIGASWRRRYDSLVLFSPRSYCALPGMVMQGDPEGYPDKDEIADYVERYARRFELPVTLQEGIAHLERRGGHFIACTSRGRYVSSHAVIVATGGFQRSVVPRWAASLAAGITQVRGDAYRNPQQLPPGRVLVVGGGGTGRQIALELAGTHDVSLSIGGTITITPQRVLGRDVMVWFDRCGLLRADTATARGRFVRAHDSFPGPRLRDGALQGCGVRLRPRTISAAADECVFADGTRRAFNAVIWAAGYADDARWLRVPGAVDTNGNHIEDRGVSPIPGLFYVGRSWQTSRASALLCGVGSDAAGIVAQVTAWLRGVGHDCACGNTRARDSAAGADRQCARTVASSSSAGRGSAHGCRR